MNKYELVAKVVDKIKSENKDSEKKITRKDTLEIIETFIQEMKETILKGEKIILKDFCTFSIAERKPRKGRNPKTGEEVIIPKRKIVKIKPAKKLNTKINEKKDDDK